MEEDDRISTPTMTSVTEDLSLDETDTSSRDINTSSQITTSDAAEQGNTTIVHTPLLHISDKPEEAADATDVSMEEGSTQDEIGSTVHKPVPDIPVTQPSAQRKTSRQQRFEPGHPSGSTVQFPDMTSFQGKWYEHECFNHYWRHYHFVSMWCQKHMETYKTVLEQYNKTIIQQASASQTLANNRQPSQVFKTPISKKTVRNRKARRRRKAAKKRLKKATRNGEVVGSCTSLSQSSEDGQKYKEGDTTESAVEGAVKDEEMEITDEMLDFFAHTHKHRQERDALKKSKENTKEEKHVNIEEGEEKKERTETAPVERPGSRRTSEMQLLYGKGAAMIHGMETALQMTFDRNLDVLQPSLWPNMPLRVIF